jgi:haloalkane dehalogenase
MIPVLVGAGLRTVVPDLVGFGRSDKPSERSDYSYQRHVDWMRGLLLGLGLEHATLFGQDWGGLIGLRLATEHPERFARIVAANTFLPTGDRPPGEAFMRWREFSQQVPELPVGQILRGGSARGLAPEVIAAYDAPFPGEEYKAGARAFPLLVPISPDDPAAPANRRAWEVLRQWKQPFLCLFGDSDLVTRGGDEVFRSEVPGALGQPHQVIARAGHFLQEDAGEEIARHVVEFVRSSVSGAG